MDFSRSSREVEPSIPPVHSFHDSPVLMGASMPHRATSSCHVTPFRSTIAPDPLPRLPCQGPSMLLRRALLLSLLLAPAATSASAQDRAPRRQDNVQWSVGGGVIASPRPYEGVDMKIFPVPVVGLRAGAFFFES